MLLATLSHPAVWRYLRDDFIGKDTFFILSVPERIGLATVTTLMFVLLLFLSIVKSRYLWRYAMSAQTKFIIPLLDLVLTPILLVLAITVAPQVLYLYYVVALGDLPWQWVTRWPESAHLLQLLAMQPIDSLNTMVRGLLLWSMIAGVVLCWALHFTRGSQLTVLRNQS